MHFIVKILFFSLLLLVITGGFAFSDAFGEEKTVIILPTAMQTECVTNDTCFEPSIIEITIRDTLVLDKQTTSGLWSANNWIQIISRDDKNTISNGIPNKFDEVGTYYYINIARPWAILEINVVHLDGDLNSYQYAQNEIVLPTIYSETESTIRLGIDKENYYNDQKISIFGDLDYFVADEKVKLSIHSPSQKLVFQKELIPVEKRFFDLIHLENLDWNESGIYTISINYVNEVTSVLDFKFSTNIPDSTKTETYYIATVDGKIPIKTTLTNIERLASGYFDQKANLRFTILADNNIQGTQKVSIEIPRNLLDAKDETGKDIPFNVFYGMNTGDKISLETIEESKNDSRIITFSVEYDPSDQETILIEGTHSLGNVFSLEKEPKLEKTLRLESSMREGNFHIDSEGNIISIQSETWKKFNSDGKLLVESRIGNIESFLADSNDNLFTISTSNDKKILYKYSTDFKLLGKFSFNDNNMSVRNIVGIDLQNNIHISGEQFNKCFKVSSNLEILDSTLNCDFIQTKKITDSDGNYYRNDGDIYCKFSSDGNLIGQVTANGSVGNKQDMAISENELECNSITNQITRGIVLDSQDNVYLTFPYHIGIQKFSPELKLEMILKPEFLDLLIAVDNSNRLYVISDNNPFGNLKIYSQSLDKSNQEIEPELDSEPINSLDDALELQRERIRLAEENSGNPKTNSKCGTGTIFDTKTNACILIPNVVESEITCGKGTESVNGICQVIKNELIVNESRCGQGTHMENGICVLSTQEAKSEGFLDSLIKMFSSWFG